MTVSSFAAVFNVRDHGAKGDGVALDSPAINAAIEAAAKQGGGTVVLPAGTYLSFSIRLKSNITLHLDAGAVLLAAVPAEGLGAYDPPEPNDWGDKLQYQDFGHSHWQNSLIWGDGLQNIAITGPGLIDGTKGLVRNAGYGGGRRGAIGPDGTLPPGSTPAPVSVTPPGPPPPGAPAAGGPGPRSPVGQGNKAIGLKNCRNVTLRDFSVLNGGHFALLATGVDHLTIDNLKVDTNRDGFDIDACRNVRVSNCSVNAPNDDAIVLKSSFGLGEARATENVTITNCLVSGFDVGSLLDATFKRTQERAPDRDGPTGRIKFGTESNGGFKNITISNIVFDRSRGLALETVDGGVIEDVVISNITMRDVSNSPIFIRLGNRARGPAGTPVGAVRRVRLSGITVNGADGRFPILLAGLPGHPIEDVTIEGVHVLSRGGISLEQVAAQPADLVNAFFLRGNEPGVTGPRDPFAVPAREPSYPEPSMFGLLPASAIYARHVTGLVVRDVTYAYEKPDTRPRVVLDQVTDARFDELDVAHPGEGKAFVLRAVKNFSISRSPGVADARHDSTDQLSF
ncbi:MAG TPA: glycosyl hydrolase family 28-related protein [Lacunisphaera sp.]